MRPHVLQDVILIPVPSVAILQTVMKVLCTISYLLFVSVCDLGNFYVTGYLKSNFLNSFRIWHIQFVVKLETRDCEQCRKTQKDAHMYIRGMFG